MIFGIGPGGRVEYTGLYPGPYFDPERNHQNVSAHVGTTAFMPCFVKGLGNKSVRIFCVFYLPYIFYGTTYTQK